MNARTMALRLDYFNMVHGVTVRALGAFGDAGLDFRPQPGMRTPRELAFHIYAQEQLIAEAAREAKFDAASIDGSNPESPANAAALRALATIADVEAYANSCHRTADAIFRAMTDGDLARTVESPMGAYPAWLFFTFAYDEHWHHRGQLYTYLRLLGKQPPDLYDYQ
jgi:uncharacterized damage-inducible protein DinB